jgi:hypothetical protein
VSRTEPGTQKSVAGKVSPASIGDALRGAAREPFNWLLLAMPVAVGLELFHAGPLWKFLVSGLAVIPLAGLMGRATENLAETLGAGIGGLLNATFGNAAELIIALLILSHGPEVSGESDNHRVDHWQCLARFRDGNPAGRLVSLKAGV